MNIDDTVRAVTEKGFTERQARFLVLVARHSGVCVMRQYSAFAGIVFGQKTRKFFAKLERLGYVSTYDCAHNRARIYHLRHRDLYEAIGDPDSRLRRPPAVPRALERLMALDVILENPHIIWLSTPDEKVAHVSALTRIPLAAMPHSKVRQGDAEHVRYFPDRLPVGIHPEGRWVFVCLITDGTGGDFRGFLQRHAELLSGLPAWTVRVALPAHLAKHGQGFLQNAWNQLASPMREPVLNELRWYFEQLRDGRSAARSVADQRRFKTSVRAFSERRIPAMYHAWRQDGEAALTVIGSTAISSALDSGAGKIELLVLPHAYSHLSPLVGVA